jgi:hypothetical protein
MRVPVLLLLFLIFTLQPALSNELHVAPTGDDSNDCTSPSTPCATIHGALGQRDSESAVVSIEPGTYDDAVNVGGGNVSLVGQGTSATDVTIGSTSLGGLSIGNAHDIFVTNLTIAGGVGITDSREILFAYVRMAGGGMGINDARAIRLHGNIEIIVDSTSALQSGISLRGLSNLTYSGPTDTDSLTISGPGAGGTGIQVNNAEFEATSPVVVSGFGIGLVNDGSQMALGNATIADNGQGVVILGGDTSLGPSTLSGNANGAIVVLRGGSVDMRGANIQDNGGNGLVVRANSTVRFIGGSIMNNTGDGAIADLLSSIVFGGPPVNISGNSGTDLVCLRGSRVAGDLSDVGTVDCEVNEGGLNDHTHKYLTGKGVGQNDTEATTGPAEP